MLPITAQADNPPLNVRQLGRLKVQARETPTLPHSHPAPLPKHTVKQPLTSFPYFLCSTSCQPCSLPTSPRSGQLSNLRITSTSCKGQKPERAGREILPLSWVMYEALFLESTSSTSTDQTPVSLRALTAT